MCNFLSPFFCLFIIIFAVSLAYDWISHKVYWANSLTRTIEVLDPVRRQRKVLLDFANDDIPNNIIPRFIVLDPLRR